MLRQVRRLLLNFCITSDIKHHRRFKFRAPRAAAIFFQLTAARDTVPATARDCFSQLSRLSPEI
jgi:hypothetical protein